MTYFPSSAAAISASALPAAAALTGSEILVVTQGGSDVQSTPAALATYLGTGTIAVPGPPGVPAKGSTTTSSIVLTWTAPTTGGTPASYVLQQSATGAATWTTAATTGALSATATGLATTTGYDFRVAGANAGGTGSYSAILSNAQTSASLAAPNAVTGLAASAITSSGLTLGWVESGGAPASRTVTQRTPSGSGGYVAATGSFGMTGGTITGLAPNSTYDFQVSETNATGSSPTATLTGVTTAAATPTAVTGLAVGASTATTVALAWTNAATATGWNVLQRTPSGSGSYVAATLGVAATATGATVSGLTTGSVYDFEVVTTNSYGSSSQVAVLTGVIPTAAPQVPGQVTGAKLGTPTSTSMPITWSAPASGGTPTGYLVELSTDGGATFGTPIATGSLDIYYVANGLVGATSYVTRVTATNAGGSGTASANSAAVSTLAAGASFITITAPAAATVGTGFTPTYTTNLTYGSLALALNGAEWDPASYRQYVVLSTSGGSLPAIVLPAAGTYTLRLYSGSTLLAESRPIVVTGTAAAVGTYTETAGGVAYTVVTTPALPTSIARNNELYVAMTIKNAATNVLETGSGYYYWSTSATSQTGGGNTLFNAAADGNLKLHIDTSSYAASTRYLWVYIPSTFTFGCVTPAGAGMVIP